ncbi:MAG: MBL fold metallo-hydrolase, partial [Terriglobales bacterium]
TDLVRRNSEAAAKQLRSSSTGFRETLDLNGIRVDVLRLKHNGRKPDLNVGYIVHLGGKKILHVGDALNTVENFRRFELAKEKIDVALLPYWYAMSEEGIAIVREQVRAANVIFIHVPPAELTEARALTSQHFPAARILEKPLDSKCY